MAQFVGRQEFTRPPSHHHLARNAQQGLEGGVHIERDVVHRRATSVALYLMERATVGRLSEQLSVCHHADTHRRLTVPALGDIDGNALVTRQATCRAPNRPTVTQQPCRLPVAPSHLDLDPTCRPGLNRLHQLEQLGGIGHCRGQLLGRVIAQHTRERPIRVPQSAPWIQAPEANPNGLCQVAVEVSPMARGHQRHVSHRSGLLPTGEAATRIDPVCHSNEPGPNVVMSPRDLAVCL